MPAKTYPIYSQRLKKVATLSMWFVEDETYGDISPVRLMSNGITLLITRGCDNMCTFCEYHLLVVVSVAVSQSIMKEIQDLWDKGFKNHL
jgi:tRNA A37 methylthiotransferase MiaB